MASNGLASRSFFAFRIILNLIVIGIATNVNAMPQDSVNSGELHNKSVATEHRNHTVWLPDYQLMQPKEPTTTRKRPKSSGTSENRDENSSKNNMVNEKSNWQKQMEKISLREREKWKTYHTVENPESFITKTEKENNTMITNLDADEMKNRRMQQTVKREFEDPLIKEKSGFPLDSNENINNASKINDEENEFEKSKKNSEDMKISKKDDNDKNYVYAGKTEIENGRWGMKRKNEKFFKEESSREFGENKTDKNFEHSFSGVKFFEKGKETSEFLDDEKLKELGKKVEVNRSKIIENGRWGMSSGNEPPLEIKDEIYRRKIIENNDKKDLDTSRRRVSRKKIDKFINKREEEDDEGKSREDIWNGRWGMSENKRPEKFFKDVILSDKNIDGIVKNDNKKHSTRLRSADKKSRGMKRRNFRPKSAEKKENEYWMNEKDKDPSENIVTLKNSRRILNEKISSAEESAENRNNEKFRKFHSDEDTVSGGIQKLIQIFISPYNTAKAVADRNNIELSIDQLIPEKNGGGDVHESIIMEMQPIVIGLSRNFCDKRYR